MGCSVSKPNSDNRAASMVSICRDRKRLVKTLVRRRNSFATAQFKYNQSLRSVAASIRAFRGGEQCRLLITETIPEKESAEEESDGDDDDVEICSHFYEEEDSSIGAPLMQASAAEEGDGSFGWDFFNLFDGVRTEVANAGYVGGGGVAMEVANAGYVGGGGVAREAAGRRAGKELLEGLKGVEESFVKVFESGEEASRMLEVGAVHHLHPGLDKFQESPMKSPFQSIAWGRSISSSPMKSSFQSITWGRSISSSPMKSPFQSITWGRSASSSSSSCKSLFAFSSPCSSTWTEVNNDCFDEHKGMVSGSHSLTLGRLYAWENKLYQEAKVGEHMRKIYQHKCLQLKNQDSKCKGSRSPEKTKAEVKDLSSRILIVIRCVESISERIEKVRDEELQPQLLELLNGLMSTWKNMLEIHTTQKLVISEVKKFTRKNFEKFGNASHRLATFQLAIEVQNWCFRFAEYLSTQKAYAEALHGWLRKFNSAQIKSQSRGKLSVLPSIDDPPILLITCEWLNFLVNLPEKPVMCAMRSFSKDLRALWVQQGNEQLQKRKVDLLAKDLDRGTDALRREEGKVIENGSSRVDYLNERKCLVDNLRKKIEIEKEKHRDIVEETERMALRIFQNGFGSVFDALIEFSKASLQMYADLLKSENKVRK